MKLRHRAAVALGGAVLIASLNAPAAFAAASHARARLVAWHWAVRQIGKPYVWGGTGPGGFDCSGLVMMAYRHARVRLPRTVAEIVASHRTYRIPRGKARKGDLVIWDDGSGWYHIELFRGWGWRALGSETQGVGLYNDTYFRWTAFLRVRGANKK